MAGTTTGSWGATASLTIYDKTMADPTASDENLFFRHWLRVGGSLGKIQDARVASFNTGSGAFHMLAACATTVFSGMPYEVHGLISPSEKDLVIDAAISDVRMRSETPIWAIDRGSLYSLGPDIVDVLDVRYMTDPTDSLNLGEHPVDWWKMERTATGNQLRINPPLIASQQLILDAITIPSLGAGDLATVNIPSDAWVLWGAAARCYWMMEQQSPGQETTMYRARRAEAAREYTRLSSRFQPFVSRKVQLDEQW